MRLYNFDYKKIQENCIRRLIREGYELNNSNENEEDNEMTPFERYSKDYPQENFNVSNMTKDELSNWCLKSGDFLYMYKPFGRWRVSNANSSEIQEEIANDIQDCSYVEQTHDMDWLIEDKFDKWFGRDYVAVFLLHNTKDGDYYIIYTE